MNEPYFDFLSDDAFWNGKDASIHVFGNGGSTQKCYWRWQQFANEGIVPKPGEIVDAANC